MEALPPAVFAARADPLTEQAGRQDKRLWLAASGRHVLSYSMKSTPIAAMLVIAFWSGPCSAQPAPSLPFGLENFHWGMTGKEASVQYPAIAPETHAPSGSPVTDQSGNYIGPFHWRDCTFNLVFYFYQDQLDTITLDARAVSPACLTSIKEEVGAHSGDLATASAYNYVSDVRFAEISLSQRGSRPLVIYDTIPRQRSN